MKKFLSLLINKYVITAVAFLVLMLFLDQNDWFSQRVRAKELDQANDNAAFLRSEIAKMNKELESLQNDTTTMERYAREKYHEKRDMEDVYIVVKDTTQQVSAKK